MSLISELKRRNVFRVAIAYLFVGWLLTEVATTLLPTFGAPDWVAKVLIFIIALGFIPAVVISWVYELTPEGIKKEKEVDADQSITSDTGRKLNYITIVAVVLGVAFLVWDRIGTESPEPELASYTVPPATSASVAVLPFVNMSGSKDNEYFSDGLTETLLHMLAQIPDLQVAARTSSFAFKGDDTEIRTIAAALGVAHVLEGSVQRAGDRVRITAQLIRATDGFHVWSENYDRTLDDIFGIQDEIAEKVGGALSLSLLGGNATADISSVVTQDINAYDLYLRALTARAKGSYDALQTAEGLLKDALATDPNFVDAKVELADIIISQVVTGLVAVDDGLDEAIAFLQQALAVRSTDVHARATLAFALSLKHMFAGDFAASGEQIKILRDLVSENPGQIDDVLMLVSILSTVASDSEEALALLESALLLDPLNAEIYYGIGNANEGIQDWEAARAGFERSLQIEPGQPNAIWGIARIDLETGDILGYLDNALKMIELDPNDHEGPGLLARNLYELGLVEEADHYQTLSTTMSPTSNMARRNELIRAIVINEEGESVAIARRIIEDDVGDRGFAWQEAVRHLTRVAARRGTEAEAFAFLDRQIPGFSDINSPPGSMKTYDGRFVTAGARRGLMPDAEIQQFLDDFVAAYRLIGDDILSRPRIHVEYLAIRGDTSAAIEVALRDYFSEPVTAHLSWPRLFNAPYLDEVTADPRVQAELTRWENEVAVMREQAREYLQTHAGGI